MRPLSFLLAAGMAAAASAAQQQADSTGLAGDNFSLRGALELFKQSKDLDAFEQALNTDGNGVNNLDLDGNGQVDYIHVRTSAEGEARVVVMQAAFGLEDRQDIAALQMERNTEGAVTLQIRGDDLLYPEETIIEPAEAGKDGDGKRGGPMAPPAQLTVWLNVWSWPCVQWCYGPSWWEWSSPWYWGYYPAWWRPWSPWGWSMWWGFARPYWGWYHPVHYCRVNTAHSLYMHRRSISGTVQRRPDVRRVERPKQPGARPMDKPELMPGRERPKQPIQPEKKPATKPERKPVERKAPDRAPQRTLPDKQPSRNAPPPPSRPPQRAPGKR